MSIIYKLKKILIWQDDNVDEIISYSIHAIQEVQRDFSNLPFHWLVQIRRGNLLTYQEHFLNIIKIPIRTKQKT